ncbi:3-keto-L-gulonate-6-phosphate decarboxylase sgbH [Serratia fonticola]|uniref:3-keto-L-gulonate-6-phosphate decarboxylase sgbH n=1 Tax=Serratia fonticola TaxID=47917 RepID=A0A3S5B1I1_SERFO|nr:3-keto-L-gulonate-6-phosphate decarboxylase sgbH [Serratia fonticola]
MPRYKRCNTATFRRLYDHQTAPAIGARSHPLDAALQTVDRLHPYVDIIEAGTILCISAGIQAVGALRERCPQHTLVADLKVADAGATLAEQAFSQGANWMTVICAAPLATMASALEVAERYRGEIQIELFGRWTLEDAKAWRDLGIKQAIYHRAAMHRPAGKPGANRIWTP